MGGVRMDVNEELTFCENSKKKNWGGGGRGEGFGWGGQGGCDRRIEVFVKIQKRLGGSGGGSWVGGGGVGFGGSGWM